MSDSHLTSHPSLFDKDHGSSGPDSKIEAGPDSETPDSETPDSETPDSETPDESSPDRKTVRGAASPPASDHPSGKASEERSPRRDSSGDRNTTGEDFSRDGGEGSSGPEKPSGEKESPGPTGGRPPKAPEDRKTARLSICLTEDLLGAVERQADKANLSKSAYARRALAGKDLQTRVDQRHISKLYRAGSRMRNVAESLREGEQPSPDQAVRAAEAVEEVIDEIDRQRMD
jgi:hypothetical protein